MPRHRRSVRSSLMSGSPLLSDLSEVQVQQQQQRVSMVVPLTSSSTRKRRISRRSALEVAEETKGAEDNAGEVDFNAMGEGSKQKGSEEEDSGVEELPAPKRLKSVFQIAQPRAQQNLNSVSGVEFRSMTLMTAFTFLFFFQIRFCVPRLEPIRQFCPLA